MHRSCPIIHGESVADLIQEIRNLDSRSPSRTNIQWNRCYRGKKIYAAICNQLSEEAFNPWTFGTIKSHHDIFFNSFYFKTKDVNILALILASAAAPFCVCTVSRGENKKPVPLLHAALHMCVQRDVGRWMPIPFPILFAPMERSPHRLPRLHFSLSLTESIADHPVWVSPFSYCCLQHICIVKLIPHKLSYGIDDFAGEM